MAKGRKNGCPTNIRDWSIFILDKASVTERWVRIKGLTEMNRSTDSDTEDGSAATDTWEEPYVTKRNGSLSLEGKPLVDASSGEEDEGQAMLDDYASEAGCEGDATLKIVDPYGSAIVADFIVTGTEVSSDDTEDTKSWDLEQVGEAEQQVYVQLSGLSLKDGSDTVSTLTMQIGDTPKTITIAFAPANASNQRFRIGTSSKRKVAISNITENSFTITPMGEGTATITVTSVNNARTTTLTVTVTE